MLFLSGEYILNQAVNKIKPLHTFMDHCLKKVVSPLHTGLVGLGHRPVYFTFQKAIKRDKITGPIKIKNSAHLTDSRLFFL